MNDLKELSIPSIHEQPIGADWISKELLAEGFREELESLQAEIEYLTWKIEEKKKASSDYLQCLWRLHKTKKENA